MFFVNQLLSDLHATFIFRFVIALNDLQWTAKYAALRINLCNGELHTIAHRHTHRCRTASQRAGNANFDRLSGNTCNGPCDQCRSNQGFHFVRHVSLQIIDVSFNFFYSMTESRESVWCMFTLDIDPDLNQVVLLN